MKVKIGNNIYDSENEPIMIILSDNDKSNITNMHSDCTKYCSFPNDSDKDKIELFMTDDAITCEQSSEPYKELFKEMMNGLKKHPTIITFPTGSKIKWVNLPPTPPPPRKVYKSKNPKRLLLSNLMKDPNEWEFSKLYYYHKKEKIIWIGSSVCLKIDGERPNIGFFGNIRLWFYLRKIEKQRGKRRAAPPTPIFTKDYDPNLRKEDQISCLKKELEVTESLLKDRQRVLDAIPECKSHGSCVPHALDWIKEMKDKS